MKQIVTRAIVLSRTDFGEADRILTLLTPDQGKLSLLAKGVRRHKSKLAGGIELFSTSDITYMRGRGELGTLISSRLVKYYDGILGDITRVQLGYSLIRQLHRATEDEPETDYYELLEQAYEALADSSVPLELVQSWFEARLLAFSGHGINLRTDTTGNNLTADATYNFDFDTMCFALADSGKFDSGHIKTLRLIFSGTAPSTLSQVGGLAAKLPTLAPVIKTAFNTSIRV